jgi:hypothetical protein
MPGSVPAAIATRKPPVATITIDMALRYRIEARTSRSSWSVASTRTSPDRGYS